jgi:hypothetical protein
MTSVEPIATDRAYISQFAPETVGIGITAHDGTPLDPDRQAVTASLYGDATGTLLRSAPAVRVDVGKYTMPLSSSDTSTPGIYSVRFSYLISTQPDIGVVSLLVGQSAPAYDALQPGMKDIVEAVWVRFADLYDSPNGGPHLQTYLQSHFGRNRLAQLMRQAVGRLNVIAQPHSTYGLDLPFDFVRYGYVLEQSLYIETVKHLVRTYTEQPEVILGTSISRMDRRDYMTRWASVLEMEEDDYKRIISGFKLDHMGLGNVRVLVGGGVFGRYGNAGWGVTGGGAAARGLYGISRAY